MDHHSELGMLHKYVATLLEDQVNSVKSFNWPTEGDKRLGLT